MQKFVYCLLIISIMVTACTTTQNTTSTAGNAKLSGYFVKDANAQADLVNYYAIEKNRDFEKMFGVTETVGATVANPDFEDDFVVAVVGKPTTKEMTIDIVKTEIVGEELNVHYDVKYTWNDLTFSVTPLSLMTVSKDKGIRTVNFYSDNTLRKSISL